MPAQAISTTSPARGAEKVHDLALHQLGWHDVDLKGAFFADALVQIWILLHRLWHDLECFGHREVSKGLGRCNPRLLFLLTAFIRDRLGPLRHRCARVIHSVELQLREIELLAFAATEHPLLEPGELRAQDRVLVPQHLHFLGTGRGITQLGHLRNRVRAHVPSIKNFRISVRTTA